MSISSWLIYLTVVLLSVFSPGPAVLLAISNGIAYGPRKTVFSCLGNIGGLLVISSLTVAGLGTLLKTSATLFLVLKVCGAAYLVWLGIRQWRSRVLPRQTADASAGRRSPRQLFVQGMLLALSNPKAILFFTALFPQFLDANRPLLPQAVLLTGTLALFSFSALMIYALVAGFARHLFESGTNIRLFNRISGSLFVLLGIGLLRLEPVS